MPAANLIDEKCWGKEINSDDHLKKLKVNLDFSTNNYWGSETAMK